jgi:hypothetical protein
LALVLPLLNLAQPPPCTSKGWAMLLLKTLHPQFMIHHRVGVVVAHQAQERNVQYCPPNRRLEGRE